MSVYDFNNHEQLAGNNNYNISNNNSNINNNNNTNGNGNGNSNSSCNNLSNNGQRARPTELVTSKTAMYVRQRRAMLEQLSCHLCQGYLIDATTIDECMDSFCKSCIIKHLRTHSNCPKCGVLIHQTNPLGAIRSDKVLQDIVYKLVPGLYDDEMKRRRNFYRALVGSSSSEDDDDGSSGSLNGTGSMYNEKYGVISHPKQFYKPTDSIDLSIEPHTRADSSTIYYDNRRQSIVTSFTGNNSQQQQQQLLSSHSSLFSIVDSQKFKTYLRCPAKLTALQLKKLIAAKFNICRDDTIHLLYLNEALKDVYSLIDIAYIYDWRGIEHMRLFYKIERDLSRSKDLQDSQRTPKTQSVGTSTQTVKRVCIDPNPKYYEVQCAINPSINGRSMRPREDSQTNGVAKREVALVTTSSPSPILRSGGSGSVRDSNSQTNRTVATNTNFVPGFKSRELVNLGAGAQGARQSQFTDAVSTAIDELSRVKQDAPKDTRSSRKTFCESTATRSVPRININMDSLNRSQANPFSKSGVTYSKIGSEFNDCNGSKDINSNQIVSNQVAPLYIRHMQAAQVTSHPQSSLVTLASFTQAQNNHIVAVSHSTTTSISGAPKGYIGHQPQSLNSSASSTSTQPVTMTSNQPQQLTFSSTVTERGTVIIGRKNNRDGPASPASSGSLYSSQPVSESRSTSTGLMQSGAQQTSSAAVSRHSGPSGGSSPRNHLKAVKPVYKLLVDPSKIKSPNYKKLSTARH